MCGIEMVCIVRFFLKWGLYSVEVVCELRMVVMDWWGFYGLFCDRGFWGAIQIYVLPSLGVCVIEKSCLWYVKLCCEVESDYLFWMVGVRCGYIKGMLVV